MNDSPNPTSRREFLRNSTAAVGGALAAPFVLTTSSRAQSPGETLRIGLVGCGGRGSGAAAQALKADKNVELTALGDAFEEPVQRALKSLKKVAEDKVKVQPDQCFHGLDAYQ